MDVENEGANTFVTTEGTAARNTIPTIRMERTIVVLPFRTLRESTLPISFDRLFDSFAARRNMEYEHSDPCRHFRKPIQDLFGFTFHPCFCRISFTRITNEKAGRQKIFAFPPVHILTAFFGVTPDISHASTTWPNVVSFWVHRNFCVPLY
jgi:hypothetical protein